MKPIIYLFAVIVFISCNTNQPEQDNPDSETGSSKKEAPKRPVALDNGKIFTKNDRKYLYGGEDSTWHFDITGSPLNDEQYHYGIGREKFKALIEPDFISMEEADTIYEDQDRFLLLQIGNDVRAYGIDLLTRHEVVNDVVAGQPVMAVYCILADLGAIYSRKIGNQQFTFALSGYTYYDPEVWDGMDGFVLWDRETESTWWPLIGKAVSGPLLNTEMTVYEDDKWSQTTWGNIKKEHTRVKVLKPGQDMEVPKRWPRYDDETIASLKALEAEGKAIAPRWGENDKIEN